MRATTVTEYAAGRAEAILNTFLVGVFRFIDDHEPVRIMTMPMEQTRPLAQAARPAGLAATLLLFGTTLFLSALLLFSVQPLFAKMVLPRVGGTPAVWSVAMVFFQAMLLAGYAYAHALVRFARPATGLVIHVAVLAIAVIWLPFQISSHFEHPPESGVALWLLALFFVSIGAPFFAVAANAPLLQAWFSRTGHRHAHDPYFLYGASNLGSFMALVSYPVLLEPAFTIGEQSRLWLAVYVALAAGVAACGLVARSASSGRPVPVHGDSPAQATARPVPTTRTRLSWMVFAAIPSALLVAVTAHISTNVAAAPFLWTMPLALYLLTFVITFQRRPIIQHLWMRAILPITTAVAAVSMMVNLPGGIVVETAIHLVGFFVAAMVCHGELVARRPDASRLTEFYLVMSFGGILGGAFTTLLAPILFTRVLEYPILVGAAVVAMPETRALIRRYRLVVVPAALAAVIALWAVDRNVIQRERSFFGVLTILADTDRRHKVLFHGTTIHGAQRIDDDAEVGDRPEPLTYYTAEGPMASAIAGHRQHLGRPVTVGIVGIGAGSLACHARQGDSWRYYEIDPAVIRMATNPEYFSFLSACTPKAPIVVGDARLTVMREPDQTFDVLVIDAFSSDAIPVHLMTREAIAGYMTKLAPGGILVMHISNRYMELRSVVAATAALENLAGAGFYHRRSDAEIKALRAASHVVVLARSQADIQRYLEGGWEPLDAKSAVRAWTDDYSNLVAAIMRRSTSRRPE
jgi:spermidine synthase